MGMRAILTGLTVSLVASGVTYAADIKGRGSLKDVPYVETAWNWTGFYGGLNVGYGSGSSDVWVSPNDNNVHGDATNDPTGAVLGGTIGYNHQYSQNWLIGAEADFSWMDLQGEQGKRILDGHYWSGGWDGLFTLRARVGYTVDTTLIYGTAGFAALHTNEVIAGNATDEAAAGTDWRPGWVVGAGVEHMFTDRISGKIEYLHAGFGERSGSTGYPGNTGTQYYRLDASLDLVRVGVNYKFY
jgi:outer membrane immunogenic protein